MTHARTEPGAPGGLVVAVDGPSGSGKSSTARAVAARLGLRYLDTGAMYRAMTWWMLEHGVDVDEPAAVAAAAPGVRLDVGTDPHAPTIDVDGTDVAGPIRGPQVTAAVSAVSAVPQVRALLVARQRAVIADGDIVVEGRDIGSVVAPDADLKVYLVADAAARAARRAAERAVDVGDASLTEAELARRDRLDSTRVASPLRQASDAVVVDGTSCTLDEVVERVCVLALAARDA